MNKLIEIIICLIMLETVIGGLGLSLNYDNPIKDLYKEFKEDINIYGIIIIYIILLPPLLFILLLNILQRLLYVVVEIFIKIFKKGDEIKWSL